MNNNNNIKKKHQKSQKPNYTDKYKGVKEGVISAKLIDKNGKVTIVKI